MVTITKDGQTLTVPYSTVSFYLAVGWIVSGEGGLLPGGNINMTSGAWILLLIIGGAFLIGSGSKTK